MLEIYPNELQLNLKHSGNNVSFLDISIIKSMGQLDIKVFSI